MSKSNRRVRNNKLQLRGFSWSLIELAIAKSFHWTMPGIRCCQRVYHYIGLECHLHTRIIITDLLLHVTRSSIVRCCLWSLNAKLPIYCRRHGQVLCFSFDKRISAHYLTARMIVDVVVATLHISSSSWSAPSCSGAPIWCIRVLWCVWGRG